MFSAFLLIASTWPVIRLVPPSRNRSRFVAALQYGKRRKNHQNTHRPPTSLMIYRMGFPISGCSLRLFSRRGELRARGRKASQDALLPDVEQRTRKRKRRESEKDERARVVLIFFFFDSREMKTKLCFGRRKTTKKKNFNPRPGRDPLGSHLPSSLSLS